MVRIDETTREGGGRSGRRPDPADREQLARSPVRWSRVAALFRPYRWQLGVVVALIVASSAVALATPFLVRLVIDEALPRQDLGLLLWAVGGMLAVTVVTAVFGVVQTWLSTTVGQRVMHGLRTAVFGHLQRQSLGFFTRTRGGEVQSRLTNDIGGMQSVVTSTATSAASNATTVIGTVVAMAALSWRLSLLSLLVLPPAVLADPPGGADAAHDHRAAAAAPRRPALPGRGGPVDQRRAAGQDPRRRPGPVPPVHRRPPTTWWPSRCARSWPAAGAWRR